MEIRPICSAMLRNKTGVILVGLQIALTLAVVANALFIIMQRAEKIGRPTGMDSANTIFIQSFGFGPNYDQRVTVQRDLELLRRLPGVVAASVINAVPLSGSGSASGYGSTDEPEKANVTANYYQVDEQGLEALGVKLAEGRGFNATEVQYSADSEYSEFVPSVVITRDLAHALFGDGPVLGRNVYDGIGQSAVVVGVIENMLGAIWLSSEEFTHVILQPRVPSGPTSRYVVRTEPGRRDELLATLEKKLAEADTTRAITWARPHTEFTELTYRADRRMVSFLSVIVVLMVAVTALGIVGLASFQVSVRTKQIGTRRAVGARRSDIIRYFMVENWLLTTAGVLAGTLLAFAFGHWLSTVYSLPRLQPGYVVGGVLVLWLLGQIAVFMPARRAAAIPPAVATRTV
jgi:putative ABC transport system permease protein